MQYFNVNIFFSYDFFYYWELVWEQNISNGDCQVVQPEQSADPFFAYVRSLRLPGSTNPLKAVLII